jgi:YfiH family protein
MKRVDYLGVLKLNLIQSSILACRPLRHGFSTRPAGDMALSSRQDSGSVRRARELHFSALEIDGKRAVFCNQVHGADIIEVNEGGSQALTSCDGLYTALPGISLNILTADCIAVLFYDQRLHAAAACHAGWKGAGKGIVDEVITRMQHSFGTSPEDLLVALGPGASWCCYEVGYEVVDALGAGPGEERIWWQSGAPGKAMLDLRRYIARRLQSLGVLTQNIELTGECTICHELYFSYRREGLAAGRMAATIELL